MLGATVVLEDHQLAALGALTDQYRSVQISTDSWRVTIGNDVTPGLAEYSCTTMTRTLLLQEQCIRHCSALCALPAVQHGKSKLWPSSLAFNPLDHDFGLAQN